MKWLFWFSVLLVVYTYVGYPLWLYLRSRSLAKAVRPSGDFFPAISIVMAVHNECETLPRKLRNLAELDYPADRCEIVIVSDGSTDATNEILAAHADERTRVFNVPQRQGKAGALNRGIQAAKGEIIVFTDARPLIARDAVKYLVANFDDPSVGCVCSDIGLGDPESGASVNGLGLYWRIETNVRRWEGATGSLVGAAGCLYAVRRNLVVPLPAATILDDMYIPLHVARQGSKVMFDPRARGWDRAQSDRRREFRRKVRTLTGNYQLLQLAPWLLTRQNPVRFQFVCHKVLRLLVPFALAGMLVSSLVLHQGFYTLALIAQAAFYGLASLAVLRLKRGIVYRLADVSLAFLVLNTAAVVALLYFVTGKKQVWVR